MKRLLSFRKSRRTVSFVLEDYVLRMVENNGEDLLSLQTIAERPLPKQVIENGRLIDELVFFEEMQEAVKEWGIKGRNLRFFVPQSLIILREVEVPEDVTSENVKQYIEFEIGNTIHFPFKQPIIDLYPKISEDRKVTVLAAPEDEVLKYATIFSDLSLQPKKATIQPLGIYRYLLYHEPTIQEQKVYMIVEYNLSSINVSILHQHKVEFLRHQPLLATKDFWEYDEEGGHFTFTGDEARYEGEVEDQIHELERLMNFYRFSIHQGEQEVNQIIVVGDSPYLNKVTNMIKNRFSTIPIINLDVKEEINGEPIDIKFIPALGLALGGGK